MTNQIVLSDKKETLLSMFLSITRIIAVMGIFAFHLFSLYKLDDYNLDFYSILIFCFLSGYLASNINKINPTNWLMDKTLSIMIPYWLVIIPALFLNRLYDYKETTFLSDFITLLCGNMFLEIKVYVIAWYITFILLLYFFIFLQSFIKKDALKGIFWLAGALIFAFAFQKLHYFVAFALGRGFSQLILPPKNKVAEKHKISRLLFEIQKYGYDFFLLSGGVLLFFTVILKFTLIQTLLFGLIINIIGSFFLHKISNFIINKNRIE